MYTRTHNQFSNETIYVTVRMNSKEYQSIRKYMHTPDGLDVGFPYGVHLVKHGYGWYRLVATTELRGVEKINGAMKIIRRWYKEEEEHVEADIKRLMPAIIHGVHVATFSNAHSTGEFGYLGDSHQVAKGHHGAVQPNPQQAKAPPPPAVSQTKLQWMASRLNNKFSDLHKHGSRK